jgi:UDP-N-acetyl-D-mannosaminuronic acid dehydrogenase
VTADPALVPLDRVLDESDVLIVATPHPEYRSIRTDKPVADVWNVLGKDVGP